MMHDVVMVYSAVGGAAPVGKCQALLEIMTTYMGIIQNE